MVSKFSCIIIFIFSKFWLWRLWSTACTSIVGKYYSDVKSRFLSKCQNCTFRGTRSDSIVLQPMSKGTQILFARWWRGQSGHKTLLSCGNPGGSPRRWSGWTEKLATKSKRAGMNSSYSTYSYDPITSITRLDSLVRIIGKGNFNLKAQWLRDWTRTPDPFKTWSKHWESEQKLTNIAYKTQIWPLSPPTHT